VALATVAIGPIGTAAADPGNTATNSTGVAQVGAVSAAPTASAQDNTATASATAPVSTAANARRHGRLPRPRQLTMTTEENER
jgi:hypothetical protein